MGQNAKPVVEVRRPLMGVAQPEKKPDAPNEGLGVIPFAYALVQTPSGFLAVKLEGVTAQSVTYLEPNGRPELRRLAAMRTANEIERRKDWGKT